MDKIFKFSMNQRVYDTLHDKYGTICRRIRSLEENTYRVVVSMEEEYVVHESDLENAEEE